MKEDWAIRTAVERFTLQSSASLRDIASKLAQTSANTLFGLTEQGSCMGSFSRGDLIRAVAAGEDPTVPVSWNTDFERLYIGDSLDTHLPMIEKQLGNVIPVLNESGACVRFLERTDRLHLEIGGKRYEPNHKVCVIAEIGNNHNGDIGRARTLIEAAAEGGAAGVKFQARVLEQVYSDTSEDFLRSTDFSTAYVVRQLKKFNLPLDDLAALMDYARELGLAAICTPFDTESMQWLLDYGPDAVKIASCDFSNTDLHQFLPQCNVPVLMSTGMNPAQSIDKVSDWLKRQYVDATLLHTNSTYPTPAEDVNLSFLEFLRQKSPSGLVGYSGHERGIHIALVAASMGAVVVEKHLTLDKSMEGNDHKVSLLPEELKLLCSQLDDFSLAIRHQGSGLKEVSQGEVINSIGLEKGVYVTRDMSVGDEICKEDVVIRSPRQGINPLRFTELEGHSLTMAKKAGTPLLESDFAHKHKLDTSVISALGYFGLPVRMRDAQIIWEEFEPAFVEYHMFATDLELDPNDHADSFKGLKLRFHAPEQFPDGFVLDLVSPDQGIRERSEEIVKKCGEWCLRAAELSGEPEPVSLILNVGGGISERQAAADFDRQGAFKRIAELSASFAKIDVQLLPQSMPPFPWYFGGQQFQTLFVHPEELVQIQEFGDVKFCMDLSHTFMACDELGVDFYKGIEQARPHIAYCHVSDSTPPNGEGLQVGDGVMDFRRMNRILGLSEGDRPWIPEIWNGHLDNFAGFRTAIIRLAKEFSSKA